MKPKHSLRNTVICTAAVLATLICSASVQAQTFTETFGNSAGRVSSAYVPGSNFSFVSSGDVKDGQYAIMPPQNITASTPGQTWWANLSSDHTGDPGGALMVLNAGNALNEFYQRDFVLQPGHSYRISAWRYVVNGDGGAGSTKPISWSLQVRNPSTNATLVESGDLPSTVTQAWFESTYEFTVPIDCKAVGAGVPARLALTNRSPITGGNDFYIDDISVADITPNDALDKFCPLPQADLSITKSNGVSSVKPGDKVVYTIVASNAGPDTAVGATISDTLPAALTGATWTCTAAAGGSCSASGSGNISDSVTLPTGGSVTYKLTATVSSTVTGTLANTVSVSPPAGTIDPNPSNNSATDSDTVIAPVAGSVNPVPTLGEWTLMLLSAALAGFAALRLRRARNS